MSNFEESQTVAVEQLRSLGLSAYAARTFVALVRLGEATAQEVSDASTVPRTRVYDAVEELQNRGLVDVQESDPKRFWAISTETTGRKFEREYTDRLHKLTAALDELDSRSRTTEQRGVWTVTDREAIESRVVEFIEDATDEVVFMTVEQLLTEPIIDSLLSASDRGVSVRLAEMSNGAEQRLDDRIPVGKPFDSLWEWSDTPAGRMLLVDQTKTLTSVLVSEEDTSQGRREETAIWGVGEQNGLVVVLQAMFAWQLSHSDV